MRKPTISLVRTSFALLLWSSLAVACTASDDLPPAGELTPSPNAGAVMRIVPPEGGSPVPVHLITPDPTYVQAKPPASEAEPRPTPNATEMAQKEPPVLTLEAAQQLVTFPIRIAEYVPEGYKLEPWAIMLPGPMPGDAPRGVLVRYSPEGQEWVPFLEVEQFLGGEVSTPGNLVLSAPEMVGAFEAQVVEVPEVGVIQLYWRDPELGVNYSVLSYLNMEETLRIARSFK